MASILCFLFLGISTAAVADPPDEIMVEQAYQSAAEPSPKAQGNAPSQKEDVNNKSEEKKPVENGEGVQPQTEKKNSVKNQ